MFPHFHICKKHVVFFCFGYSFPLSSQKFRLASKQPISADQSQRSTIDDRVGVGDSDGSTITLTLLACVRELVSGAYVDWVPLPFMLLLNSSFCNRYKQKKNK